MYLLEKNPTVDEMKLTLRNLELEEVSMHASYVYDSIGEFYSNLLQSTESDSLAKQIFAAASRQDSSILFRLAHRESTLRVVGSKAYWKSLISQNVEDSAVNCFERTVLEGVLDMEMFRGTHFKRRGVEVILEGISEAAVSNSRKSFFIFALEELVGPNAMVRGYSLEELFEDSKRILGDLGFV